MEVRNQGQRHHWKPLSLNNLLDKYKLTDIRFWGPLLGWALIIALCIFVTSSFMPADWWTPDVDDIQTRKFFIIYPSYIVGLLLIFWLGFEWGFIPLFISSFALAFQSGMDPMIAIVFGFSFIFGLALIGLAYQSIQMPYDLRGLKSFAFFVSVIFIASIASSICALIWSLAHDLSAYNTAQVWNTWWTGIFFQSVIITAPLIFLFTPAIEKFKQKHYGVERSGFVSMNWIYGTVVCVTIILLMFIFSGQFLGKYRVNEVLNRLPDIARGEVMGALDSFEIIFWLSIGLIIITGYTAMYLVGRWNQELRDQVDERTRQLEESKKELRNSLEEKQLLLKETHHRVKNNLAQVSGLLQLQMMTVDDEKYTQLIQDATSRIQSMSLIHQALYDTEEYAEITLPDYLEKLCMIVHKSFRNDSTDIEMKFDLGNYVIETRQAVTLGLIVTEILINAHKYAFEGRKQGIIFISLKANGGNLRLAIEDNGVGMPEESTRETSSLGMKLIRKFSQQIEGDLTIDSDDTGTRFVLVFEPAN